MTKSNLDFIIIGAQKAGTTSLFKYMEYHPQIYMPKAKEIPYFVREDWLGYGWDWYINEFFASANDEQVWGTVSPHYMIFPEAPERIYKRLPNAKLIAVLRHPIARAYSQYVMEYRRNHERRSFDECVLEALQPENLEYARQYPEDTNAYIVNSEYDRMLKQYYDLFGSENILTFFTEELAGDPQKVITEIFEFIGVPSDYKPSDLGVVYHKGGARSGIPLNAITSHFLWRQVFGKLWKVVPLRHRINLRYWIEQWSIVQEEGKEPLISNFSSQQLIDHYRPHVVRLYHLVGREAKWPEWAMDVDKEKFYGSVY